MQNSPAAEFINHNIPSYALEGEMQGNSENFKTFELESQNPVRTTLK
jgi:hypothetical protein